jgi:hypothetical protein
MQPVRAASCHWSKALHAMEMALLAALELGSRGRLSCAEMDNTCAPWSSSALRSSVRRREPRTTTRWRLEYERSAPRPRRESSRWRALNTVWTVRSPADRLSQRHATRSRTNTVWTVRSHSRPPRGDRSPASSLLRGYPNRSSSFGRRFGCPSRCGPSQRHGVLRTGCRCTPLRRCAVAPCVSSFRPAGLVGRAGARARCEDAGEARLQRCTGELTEECCQQPPDCQ